MSRLFRLPIPPEFAHLWDPESGCWKEDSLLAMLEILAPNRPRSERVQTATAERTPADED
jgi:hypothetical protein